MKKLLWLLVAVVVIGLAVVLFVRMKGGDDGTVSVQTEPASRMKIVQAVDATGRIQPMTQVNISADVSAKITRLDIEEGDWVEKGALLLQLDRERYAAAVESSEASLRVMQSNVAVTRENLTKAEKDYQRTRDLFEKNLETQAQLDAAHAVYEAEKARHQAARDQVAQGEAALKQAQDDLSKTSIYAPMAGTISQLNKEAGEIALGSQFQEDVIMVVSNLEGMEALVDVDENDIVSVAIGDSATIEVDALPDLVLQGEVTEIANSAKVSGSGTTDQKTEFEVKITVLDATPQLRPGMTATSDIVTETQESALGVPIQSVAVRTLEQLGRVKDQQGGQGWEPDKDGFVEIVWVIEGGTAHARPVTTGIQSETHIEIIDGLSEGEQVVTGNYRAISKDLLDGSTVTVEAETDGPESKD